MIKKRNRVKDRALSIGFLLRGKADVRTREIRRCAAAGYAIAVSGGG
jgi:hypothetical protein